MLKHWLKGLLVLVVAVCVAGSAGSGCLKVSKEDGHTKVRPGTIEIHHNEQQNQAANDATTAPSP